MKSEKLILQFTCYNTKAILSFSRTLNQSAEDLISAWAEMIRLKDGMLDKKNRMCPLICPEFSLRSCPTFFLYFIIDIGFVQHWIIENNKKIRYVIHYSLVNPILGW